eukprot:scaffold47404_cov71-Cyclotella_meneghiniana.AAC.2
MLDNDIILAGAVPVGGLVAGAGLLAFAESMGEHGKARGGGLSDSMATKLSGALLGGRCGSRFMLKESGGADAKELEMSEVDKKRIAEEADDGWSMMSR